jgi:hypothetical protein
MTPLDDDALIEITPEDLRLYLSGSKWVEAEIANDFLSVWTRADIKQDVFVPRTTRAIDYLEQLSVIVRILSNYEDRKPKEIIADMKHASADVIRIRLDTSALDRGTIPFSKAAQVLEESQKMLLSAARAAVHPQNFFTSRPPSEVAEYMDSAKLGQTEPGSFIFTIVSPISITREFLETTIQPRGEEVLPTKVPFARQVTNTLERSLTEIRNATRATNRPLTAVFEDLVDYGVSANLCEALSGIAAQSVDHAVDIGFRWSSKPELEMVKKPSNVIVSPIITPSLQDIARHLKSVAPEPGFEAVGKVERLSNQDSPGGFDLALRAVIYGRERLLALELSDDEREIASTAWSTGRSVFTRGTLDKRFRPFRLLKPERFELLERSD